MLQPKHRIKHITQWRLERELEAKQLVEWQRRRTIHLSNYYIQGVSSLRWLTPFTGAWMPASNPCWTRKSEIVVKHDRVARGGVCAYAGAAFDLVHIRTDHVIQLNSFQLRWQMLAKEWQMVFFWERERDCIAAEWCGLYTDEHRWIRHEKYP